MFASGHGVYIVVKKKTDRDVSADETSAVSVVSARTTPSSAGAAIEPMGVDAIRSRILTVRGVQVMLAPDLADLYQVETRSFNQAVKRNIKRFPENFRFQLTKEELEEVITNCDNPDRLRFSPQTRPSRSAASARRPYHARSWW